MPRKTRHENLYILLSVVLYAAIVTAYFFIPWKWYIKLPALIGVAVVYELALYFVVKRFK